MPPQLRRIPTYNTPRDDQWFRKTLNKELGDLVWNSLWKTTVLGLVFLTFLIPGMILTVTRMTEEPLLLGLLLGLFFAFVIEIKMRRWIYKNSTTFRPRKLLEFRKVREELQKCKLQCKDPAILERIPDRLKEVTALIEELENQMKPPAMRLVGKTSPATARDLYSSEKPDDNKRAEQVA